MLKVLRSTEDKKAVFKKGDKLITSNVINNNTIEYIINRPIKTYLLKSIQFNKYIKVNNTNNNEHRLVDLVDDATFFTTYKKAKEFKDTELSTLDLDIDIIEVID